QLLTLTKGDAAPSEWAAVGGFPARRLRGVSLGSRPRCGRTSGRRRRTARPWALAWQHALTGEQAGGAAGARVHEITLAVHDLDRALAFYRAGLELESPGVVGSAITGDQTIPAGAVAKFDTIFR